MSKDNRKIWVLTELYWPSITSTGFILTKIAEGLAEENDVAVITGPPVYDGKFDKYPLKEDRNHVAITRIKLPYLSKNSVIKRTLRLFLLSIRIFLKSCSLIKANSTLLLVTTPVTMVFIAAILQKFKRGLRSIVVIHDVYPDNMVVAGLIEPNGFQFRILDKAFRWAIAQIETVVVLGRDMQAVLERKGHQNIRIIENWAEPSVLRPPIETNDDQTRSKTTFLFAGNIGRLQGIDRLLSAIELTPQSATFVFAGGGAMENEVRKKLLSLAPGKITLLGSYDRAEQSQILSSCDVGIVSLDQSMYGLGVPSKAYNIMAAGKPIFYIGDPDSELHLVISDSDCGWFADAASTDGIASQLSRICELTNAQLKRKAHNSFKLGSKCYTEHRAVFAYKALVAELAGGSTDK